jgi:hypothetical protein
MPHGRYKRCRKGVPWPTGGATAVHEPVQGLGVEEIATNQMVRFPRSGSATDPPQLPGRGFPLAPQDVGMVQLRPAAFARHELRCPTAKIAVFVKLDRLRPANRAQSCATQRCPDYPHRSLHSRSNCRTCLASRSAAAEYKPCFQLARLERASPSAVRGPVLAPPCRRHRRLSRMAGQRHGVPFRVLAPHRGAALKSPGGLPFFSHPRRCA